jgi:1-acyl-sn-glycerol-3-phosphate acyltransferase
VADLVYPPVVATCRLAFRLLGMKVEVTGAEHVPATGGAVLASNHVSYLDFVFAGLAGVEAGRLTRFMAKDGVFKHRVGGPLMRGMHHIPVDRDAGGGSYRAAVDALSAGEIVGVFPEATISRSFELKDFKAGAARMAGEAGVPILPTVIWGSQRVWTKDRPKQMGRTRTPISVHVGSPMPVVAGSDYTAVTAELRARMEQMLHDAQKTYGDEPAGPEDSWWLPARLGGTAPTPDQALQLDRDELRARLAVAKRARDEGRSR